MYLLLQLGVGEGLRGVGDVAVMDERSLVTPTSCDMHIQSLVARVHVPTFVCVCQFNDVGVREDVSSGAAEGVCECESECLAHLRTTCRRGRLKCPGWCQAP